MATACRCRHPRMRVTQYSRQPRLKWEGRGFLHRVVPAKAGTHTPWLVL